MSIRNIRILNFSFFKKNDDEEKVKIETIKKIEKEEVDLTSNLICDDFNILMKIGTWLQTRDDYVNGMDYNWNVFSSDNNIDMTNISKKELKKIKDDFYSILVNNDIGIIDDEIITITGVTTINENPLIKEILDNCNEQCFKENEDSFSFNCHFKSANKDAIISLDNYFNLIVYIDNMFLKGSLSCCDSSLKFHVIEKYYPESKNEIFKSYSDDEFRLHFRNGSSSIQLEFSPVEKDIEKKLELLINKITFPFNQKNLFDDIIECLDGNVTKIRLNSYKYNEKINDFEDNNDFFIKDGIVESIEKSLFSKNGEEKTIYLDLKGNWSFESRNIKIEFTNDNKEQYSYELKKSDLNNIYSLPTLQEQFEEALDAVEEIRELMSYYTSRLSNKAMKKRKR